MGRSNAVWGRKVEARVRQRFRSRLPDPVRWAVLAAAPPEGTNRKRSFPTLLKRRSALAAHGNDRAMRVLSLIHARRDMLLVIIDDHVRSGYCS